MYQLTYLFPSHRDSERCPRPFSQVLINKAKIGTLPLWWPLYPETRTLFHLNRFPARWQSCSSRWCEYATSDFFVMMNTHARKSWAGPPTPSSSKCWLRAGKNVASSLVTIDLPPLVCVRAHVCECVRLQTKKKKTLINAIRGSRGVSVLIFGQRRLVRASPSSRTHTYASMCPHTDWSLSNCENKVWRCRFGTDVSGDGKQVLRNVG